MQHSCSHSGTQRDSLIQPNDHKHTQSSLDTCFMVKRHSQFLHSSRILAVPDFLIVQQKGFSPSGPSFYSWLGEFKDAIFKMDFKLQWISSTQDHLLTANLLPVFSEAVNQRQPTGAALLGATSEGSCHSQYSTLCGFLRERRMAENKTRRTH